VVNSVVTRSKAWACDRLFVGTAVSNPVGGRGNLSLVWVVWCQLEVSVSGWSLVQSIPTDCCVSEFGGEVRIMGRPWPTGAYRAMREQFKLNYEF